jgi:hypothetical protein
MRGAGGGGTLLEHVGVSSFEACGQLLEQAGEFRYCFVLLSVQDALTRKVSTGASKRVFLPFNYGEVGLNGCCAWKNSGKAASVATSCLFLQRAVARGSTGIRE